MATDNRYCKKHSVFYPNNTTCSQCSEGFIQCRVCKNFECNLAGSCLKNAFVDCPICDQRVRSDLPHTCYNAAVEAPEMATAHECCGGAYFDKDGINACPDCPDRNSNATANLIKYLDSKLERTIRQVTRLVSLVESQVAVIEKQNAILNDAAATAQSLCAIAEAQQARLDSLELADECNSMAVDTLLDWYENHDTRLGDHAEMLHLITALLKMKQGA